MYAGSLLYAAFVATTVGIYWLTAFAGGPPEAILGVDLATGAVVVERRPSNGGGNVIDMAWVPTAREFQTELK